MLVKLSGNAMLDAPACIAAVREHLGLGRGEATQLVDAIARGAAIALEVESQAVADALHAALASAGARAEPA